MNVQVSSLSISKLKSLFEIQVTFFILDEPYYVNHINMISEKLPLVKVKTKMKISSIIRF